MHPSTIILALASAALIHAVAIPQPAPAPTRYDTCLDQYAKIFELAATDPEAGTMPQPGSAAAADIAKCTSCAGKAVAAAFLKYDPTDVKPAKAEYTAQMAVCRGTTTDAKYNSCIDEYAIMFQVTTAQSQTLAPAGQCTGCAAASVVKAFEVFVLTDDTDRARFTYAMNMADCRAMA